MFYVFYIFILSLDIFLTKVLIPLNSNYMGQFTQNKTSFTLPIFKSHFNKHVCKTLRWLKLDK